MDIRIIPAMLLDTQTFFRMLSDDTRLRVLVLLQQEGELCVCELTHALDLSQPKISRHLAQLRESGVVQTRRAGQWMYYRMNTALPAWAEKVMLATLEGVSQTSPFNKDFQVLKNMPNRPGADCCA